MGSRRICFSMKQFPCMNRIDDYSHLVDCHPVSVIMAKTERFRAREKEESRTIFLDWKKPPTYPLFPKWLPLFSSRVSSRNTLQRQPVSTRENSHHNQRNDVYQVEEHTIASQSNDQPLLSSNNYSTVAIQSTTNRCSPATVQAREGHREKAEFWTRRRSHKHIHTQTQTNKHTHTHTMTRLNECQQLRNDERCFNMNCNNNDSNNNGDGAIMMRRKCSRSS